MNLIIRTCLLLLLVGNTLWVFAEQWNLPTRENPRPETTDGIPHIQIDVEPVPELKAKLLHQVSQIAGIELRSTIVGRTGSTGFWIQDDRELVRPQSVIRGREFAHLHPDGSLHASLPLELANKAIEAGWAVGHPWATQKRGLEGFVMIYTPLTEDELDVVMQLIRESHGFVAKVKTATTD